MDHLMIVSRFYRLLLHVWLLLLNVIIRNWEELLLCLLVWLRFRAVWLRLRLGIRLRKGNSWGTLCLEVLLM